VSDAAVERVDAVVIGAGPNGLVAAITLAEAGRGVVVLEAQDRPGGAVLTEELTLPGLRHDTFSATYPAAAASPALARMPLADHGLRWVHPPVAMAHPLDDGRAAALHRDLEATIASLESMQPGDGVAWGRFARGYLDHIDALRHVLLGGFPPVWGGLRLAAGLRLAGTLEFARLLLAPATALACELFTGPHAQAWLYGSALHGDVPLAETGSAISGTYLQLLGHAAGWPSPQGGAGALTDALVSYLRSLGGQVRTGARVDRVVARHGRVAGVITAGGRRYRTGTVVADVGPQALLRLAGDAFDDRYRRTLGRFRYGPGTVKVDWALSAPLSFVAEAANAAGTIHLGGGPEELAQGSALLRAGQVPDRPFLLAGQQSRFDLTRTPGGTGDLHALYAYTHVPHEFDWAAQGERFLGAIEAQVDRFAPGFRDLIRARHVLAPGDLQRRNPNLVHGDVGGGTYQLDQIVFRPVPSIVPYRTPVRGLVIGSASAFPGGAVHGVPGRAAARVALWQSRLP
jgi:phytoene dehydrogenase-like protein